MKKFFNNKYFKLLPEFLILALVLLYWFSSSLLNPIAITLIVTIGYLIFSKNRIIGLVIGSIILLLGLYLILALLSDIHKITNFNGDAIKFIIYASLFICTNILTSVWLIIKYSIMHPNENRVIQKLNN